MWKQVRPLSRKLAVRTIDFILVCIAALMVEARAVRAREASVGGGYSVSVICLLVPYRHCVLSISGARSPSNIDPAGFVIVLQSENILIPPGYYRGHWTTVSSGCRAASLGVDLLIAHGRGHLVIKRGVRKRLLRRTHGRNVAFTWQSNSLPLSIRNVAVKQGTIRAILLYENREMGSSEDAMWPARGCWFNEVQCVPH